MKLKGRGILISGASLGLGREIARVCVAEGASVHLCARDGGRLEEAKKELSGRAQQGQVVGTQVVDVSRGDDVSRWIESARRELPRIDGLVNNAGVYGPMGLSESVDWTEWTRAIEINLYGTMLPCRAAIPLFRKQGYGKIVNLSGGGATAPLPRISSYAASKAAVVRLTETLAEELQGTGIDVNVVAPGALDTRLLDEVLKAGPERVGGAFYEKMVGLKKEGGTPLEKGASLCVFLLSQQSDGITGRLLSAVWDHWADLPKRRVELQKSDVYTLRRIVPKDRGLPWE